MLLLKLKIKLLGNEIVINLKLKAQKPKIQKKMRYQTQVLSGKEPSTHLKLSQQFLMKAHLSIVTLFVSYGYCSYIMLMHVHTFVNVICS